jgi:hypothetical protein
MEDNKHMPAHPTTVSFSENKPVSYQNGNTTMQAIGLTKREKIAAMALQGMLAKSHAVDGMTEHEVNSITADAVMFADELLNKLEG